MVTLDQKRRIMQEQIENCIMKTHHILKLIVAAGLALASVIGSGSGCAAKSDTSQNTFSSESNRVTVAAYYYPGSIPIRAGTKTNTPALPNGI